jgi:hypothetical protein
MVKKMRRQVVLTQAEQFNDDFFLARPPEDSNRFICCVAFDAPRRQAAEPGHASRRSLPEVSSRLVDGPA